MNALTKAMKFYMIICNMPITTLRANAEIYFQNCFFFFKKSIIYEVKCNSFSLNNRYIFLKIKLHLRSKEE